MLDFFFVLLRSGLYASSVAPEEIPREIDWRQIMTLAAKQTVMALVYDAASRLPEDAQPPKELQMEMLSSSVRVMKSHQLLDSTLSELIHFYRSHGIEGVLLKGQGIARCYRSPILRQCGDIDLYIGKKNYATSVELAVSHLASPSQETTESIKHFHFDHGKVTVELHRIAAMMHSPILRQRFDRWIEEELDDAARYRQLDFGGTAVNIPSADFDAFFIFYHAWYHFLFSGIGLRQLCDWTMVLHHNRDAINREALEKRLKQFGLVKAWKVFGCIAVERLGLPCEEMPLYDPSMSRKSTAALKKIIDDGNFGHHDPDRLLNRKKGTPLLKRKGRIFARVIKDYKSTFTIVPIESTFYMSKLVVKGGFKTLWQLSFGRKTAKR